MPEFLVRTETSLPAEMSDAERLELRTAERARAAELRAAGHLRRIWRVPGRTGSVQLWEAPDATVLHEDLSSLPTVRWMDIVVEPLAVHPQEADLPTNH
jgi:muconolactone D-isomerase